MRCCQDLVGCCDGACQCGRDTTICSSVRHWRRAWIRLTGGQEPRTGTAIKPSVDLDRSDQSVLRLVQRVGLRSVPHRSLMIPSEKARVAALAAAHDAWLSLAHRGVLFLDELPS